MRLKFLDKKNNYKSHEIITLALIKTIFIILDIRRKRK